MKQTITFLALVLSGSLFSIQANADIKRNHKPWFGGEKSEAPKKRLEAKAPRSAVKRPIKQVRRYRSRDRIVASRQTESLKVASVPKTALEPVSQSDNQGAKIAEKASSYKGTRYRFGGTTKKGLDCSGLVSRVWDDLQMNKIPRASSALYEKGTPVKLAELRPGDLVFFKNTYKRGISHVGVYAGKNRFVHASARRGVTTAKLSEPYYQLRYAGARRLY